MRMPQFDIIGVNLHNDILVVIVRTHAGDQPSTSTSLPHSLAATISTGAGNPMNDTGTAGVIARPPVLYAAALLLGLAADHLLPLAIAVPEAGLVHWTTAGLLIVAGVAFMAAGIRDFSRGGTPVPTNQPSRALVTTGIHRWSRNPIYVGMFLIYAGLGVAARSPWIAILTLPLAITIRYGVVAREEAYLERRFGDAFRDYKSRVRRWL